MRSNRRQAETAGSRIGPLAILPVFFDLKGRRCVVAGGADSAAWKAELLAAAGADVDIYSPQPCDSLLRLAARGTVAGSIRLHRRAWTEAGLAGAVLAVATHDVEGGAAAFRRAAHAAGALVNVIDRPSLCDIQFGAIVNRSPVVVGISTAGTCPALGQAIRRRIEMLLPSSMAHWAAAAGRVREQLKRRLLGHDVRRRFWDWFADTVFTGASAAEPETVLLAKAASVADGQCGGQSAGALTLVEVGDPRLLTVRAIQAIQRADVVLFDESVAPDILAFAGREVPRLPIAGQQARHRVGALAAGLAREGKRVVRLHAGSPAISRRGETEIDSLAADGIPVELLPGDGRWQRQQPVAMRPCPTPRRRREPLPSSWSPPARSTPPRHPSPPA